MRVVEVAEPVALAAHETSAPHDRLAAREPPEARGLPRDSVRLLVGRGSAGVSHHWFTDLPLLLRPGDVLVVNTSATLPAAVPVADESGLVVHFSTEHSASETNGAAWLIELRSAAGAAPHPGGGPGRRYPLPGGAALTLRTPHSQGRLWVADVDSGAAQGVLAYLHRYGRPIRYSYVDREWDLSYYQTVFATHPGSAEMPSAARAFTDRTVTRLVTAGVLIVPVLLHTGVASAEAHERPYPERFCVPAVTARMVTQTRLGGGRVIAVGTTTVRALESAADEAGVVRAAHGWTDLVITPERGVRSIDGLLTGLHEPRASHLDLIATIAGADLVARCYAEAAAHGYLWHEFGDLNLLLP
jgi:S-adenosylmethionine:tRNA ribosyltransferase-isomerase